MLSELDGPEPGGQALDRIHALMQRVQQVTDFEESADAITSAVTDVLGFGVAALCIARVDGMFEVVSFAGPAEARAQMVGSTAPVWDVHREEDVTERWGMFEFISQESYRPWNGPSYVPEGPAVSGADSWHPLNTLQAPLLGPGGGLVGLLQVDDPPGWVFPSRGLRQLLDVVAVQAGMLLRSHLERLRMTQEVELANLSRDVLALAVDGSDLDTLMSQSAEKLLRGLSAVRVAIRLTGADGDLPVGSWRAFLPGQEMAPPPIVGQLADLAGRAWAEHRAVALSVRKPEPNALPGVDAAPLIKALVERGIETVLLAPIGAANLCLGYVVLMRAAAEHPWTEAETQAAAVIGRDLGTAVLNVHLLERERQYAEQLERDDELKKALFATISHEFRGPLTSILGHAELLGEGPPAERAASSIAAIARNAGRLSDLVADLLVLQQLEDVQADGAEPVDLVQATANAVDVWEVIADREDVHIDFDSAQPPALALGDRVELGRMVANLVSNAVKYSRPGGTVRIRIGREGEVVRFTCADDGIGISAPEQGQLFGQFFRGGSADVRRVSGTGLGLHIVKRILDQHGGTIDVQSEVGVGSTFEVTLPAA